MPDTGPQTTNPQPGPRGNQVDLGTLTRIGAVTAAIAYATGILTINTYLHKLGITDFSFAKPKLILTGVLVLLGFLLLAILPTYVAWEMAQRGQTRSTTSHSVKTLFLLTFPLVALILASAYLCFGEVTGLGQITIWGIWELFKRRNFLTKSLASLAVALEVYIPICLAAVSTFAAVRLLKRRKEMDTQHPIWREIYFPVTIALAVVFVVLYIYVFALTFYPAVPQAFGGGKPYFESLVIAENGRCPLQQLGIPFLANQPNVTKALPVLHESDSLVAVWLEKKLPRKVERNDKPVASAIWISIVVQIDKSLISASMADPHASRTPQLTEPPSPAVPCQSSSTPSTATSSSGS